MFWTIVSVAVCAALMVKLMFYSDDHRQRSRLHWRIVLFLTTVYAAAQVVSFMYHPGQGTSPWTALAHVLLLHGSFWIRPEYLPWNGHHDPAIQIHRAVRDVTSRLRYGLRSAELHGQQGKAPARKR